jgi:MSHA biogenesis protein MshQ
MLTRAVIRNPIARATATGALVLLALAWGSPLWAATCTANSTGNWGTAGIWSCGNVPASGDNVVIPNGVTVTLNVNSARIADLNVNAGGVLQGDNTNKTFTINNGTGTDVTNNGTIDFGPGKLAIMFSRQSTTWTGAGSWTFSTINLNGNTLNFAGGTTATIVVSGAAAPITNAGTIVSLTTVTWDFAGTVAQILPTSTNIQYGNLTVSNTTGTTLGVGLTSSNIIGNLTVATNGILNNGGFSVALASGKSLQVQAAGTLNLTGTSTMVSVSGGGTKTFNATSTVNYGGANQNVTAETYGNLTLSGSGTKTIATGTTTIAGDLTLASGVTYNGTTNNPTVNLKGDFSHGGTFNSGTGTYTFNGTAAQALTGTAASTTFTNLAMNNAAGLTLGHNVTVGTLLTLTSGAIVTGTNTLITSAFCPGSISRTGGYVAGNLQLRFNTGAQTCTFHVGDAAAANYAPITVAFGNVSAAGSLIGTTTAGDFGDANLPVDPTLDVSRYWTLTLPGAGALAFTGSYGTTLGYVAGDNDASATPSKYLVAKGDTCAASCTTWSFPTLSGVPTNVSAGATGLTTLAGIFVVGEHRVFGFRVDNPGSPPGTNIPDQTQSTPFNIRITAIDPQGNTVTQFTGTADITPSAGCTLSAGGGTTGAFSAGALASYSVTVSSVGACSITAKQTTDATRTGTSNTFNVIAAVASFNAVQPGAAATATAVFTKIVGTDFAIDLLALNSSGVIATGFTGTVAVEVVDNSGGGACNTLPVLATFSNQTFAAADSGRHALTPGNNVGSAYRNAKIRIKYPTASPTITSCSLDNFAIRPASLGVVVQHANRTTEGTTTAIDNTAIAGATVHNAGRPFRITATAYRSDGTTVVTNYDPTSYSGPTAQPLAACVGTACTGTFGTLTPGTWSASSGVITTTTASYSEVGAFSLQLQDASFAAVDSGDTGIGSGYIIPSTAVDVGRFVPDHFDVSAASITPRSDIVACAASAFTYVDEKMSANFTLTAMNFGGTKTSLYAGGLARLDLSSVASFNFGAIDGAVPTPLTGRIDTTMAPAVTPTWSAGATTVAWPIAIRRLASPDGPYSSVKIGIAPSDPDTVTLAAFDLDADNSGTSERAQIGTTGVRFGRLRVLGGSGASNVGLPIRLRAEYWDGTVFAANPLDSCTTLSWTQVQMNFSGLGACATPFTTASITFAAGTASWVLAAPGAAANGAVDLHVNLNGTGGTACVPAASTPAASAAMPYLQGRWTTSAGGYTDDPVARATFGTYGQDRLPNNLIFRRENF